MTQQMYRILEDYMLEAMRDSAHDKHHIYRVLYNALDIAATEPDADREILVAACLLHDVGREEQAQNPALDHAAVGGEKAYAFLLANGWQEPRAAHVRDCIASHRYRREAPPVTLEAKILYDADKLDATGVMGIARTLIYGGQTAEPLYLLDESGEIVTAPTEAESTTFVQEYHYKLKGVHLCLHTPRARELGACRQQAGAAFYESLCDEIREPRANGARLLAGLLES